MPGRTMSFSHDPRTEAVVVARNAQASRSQTLHQIVARYEWLMRRHRPRLKAGDWLYLQGALASTAFRDDDQVAVRMLPSIVSDALADTVPAHRDGAGLVRRLEALSEVERLALVDELERRWAQALSGDERMG